MIDREELERLSGYSAQKLQYQIDALQDELHITKNGYIEPESDTPTELTPEQEIEIGTKAGQAIRDTIIQGAFRP